MSPIRTTTKNANLCKYTPISAESPPSLSSFFSFFSSRERLFLPFLFSGALTRPRTLSLSTNEVNNVLFTSWQFPARSGASSYQIHRVSISSNRKIGCQKKDGTPRPLNHLNPPSPSLALP